jgi:hypothetical protein
MDNRDDQNIIFNEVELDWQQTKTEGGGTN